MAAPVLGAATLRTLTAENARLREELHRTATAVRQCVLTAVSASLTPRRLESRQQTSLSHDDRSVDDSVHPTHLSHMMQIRFIDVDASQAASSSVKQQLSSQLLEAQRIIAAQNDAISQLDTKMREYKARIEEGELARIQCARLRAELAVTQQVNKDKECFHHPTLNQPLFISPLKHSPSLMEGLTCPNSTATALPV